MRTWKITVWFFAALSAAASTSWPQTSAGDDDEIVVSVLPKTPEDENLEANFDQWIFPGCANAAAGRERLESQRKLQFAEIERSCQLNDEQRQRLELAARGDLLRFLEQVESLRRRFEPVKHDQQKLNEFWREIQPLQARQVRGLTGPDSLLTKVLPRTLTKQQARQFDEAQNERWRFRYEASIALSLHTLESFVALTNEQRQTLAKLLLELPPPRVFGQYDNHLINYRLANLPPSAKLQQLFDARQWQSLQQQFAQARAMRQHLLDQGYLLREDLDPGTREGQP
jgi:hypothetical protein